VAGAGKTTTLAMEAGQACAGGLSERAVLALCFSRGARLRFHEKLKEEVSEHSAIYVMTVEDFARQLIEDLAERGRITRPVAHQDVEGIRGELVAAAGRVWQRYEEQGIRSDFNFGLDENNQHLDDIARRLAQLKAAQSPARIRVSPSSVMRVTSPDTTITNSSSCVCQWRCDEAAPGWSSTRLTPNWVMPPASPSACRLRPLTASAKGSG
jgi:hypothetical protein